MQRAPKTPQEKKRLSLEKDRRNNFGENAKSSRKNIPRAKARGHRSNRRKQNQDLADVDRQDESGLDLVESSARRDIHRVGGWTKHPDRPLGEHIQAKVRARAKRTGQ